MVNQPFKAQKFKHSQSQKISFIKISQYYKICKNL